MAAFTDPATRLTAVTPSDSTDLSGARAVYVGTAGDLAVRAKGDDSAVTLPNVPAGAIIPVQIDRVMSTGTTASDIVALF